MQLVALVPVPADTPCRALLAAAAGAPEPLPIIEAAERLARGQRDEALARRLLALAASATDPWPLVTAARLLLSGDGP